jgi:hypothetical protein
VEGRNGLPYLQPLLEECASQWWSDEIHPLTTREFFGQIAILRGQGIEKKVKLYSQFSISTLHTSRGGMRYGGQDVCVCRR